MKMVVLAKSHKKDNYCIAGIDLDSRNWKRPISCNTQIEDAVPKNDAFYEDGSKVKIFDVVELETLSTLPNNDIQPENVYYNEARRWKKIGQMTLRQVIDLHDFDDRSIIFYNRGRKVSQDEIRSSAHKESLLLLPIENLKIAVEIYDNYPKFYSHFDYKGVQYKRISVGDPNIRKEFKNLKAGLYTFKESAISVLSLTNPFDGDAMCYKMLAHVF